MSQYILRQLDLSIYRQLVINERTVNKKEMVLIDTIIESFLGVKLEQFLQWIDRCGHLPIKQNDHHIICGKKMGFRRHT